MFSRSISHLHQLAFPPKIEAENREPRIDDFGSVQGLLEQPTVSAVMVSSELKADTLAAIARLSAEDWSFSHRLEDRNKPEEALNCFRTELSETGLLSTAEIDDWSAHLQKALLTHLGLGGEPGQHTNIRIHRPLPSPEEWHIDSLRHRTICTYAGPTTRWIPRSTFEEKGARLLRRNTFPTSHSIRAVVEKVTRRNPNTVQNLSVGEIVFAKGHYHDRVGGMWQGFVQAPPSMDHLRELREPTPRLFLVIDL